MDRQIDIGSFDVLRITKLFGPTAFCDLIIEQDFDTYEWVIKKEFIDTDEQGNDKERIEEVFRVSAGWTKDV